MKTIILSILLVISYTAATAQDWCHRGSKWEYSWFSMGGEGRTHFSYTNDTIVANRPCHILTVTDYSIAGTSYHQDTTHLSDIYTYSSGDSIYFYYENLHSWLALYDFSLQIGDSMEIPRGPNNGDSLVQIMVDSIGIMMIDTNHLRFYTFHLTDSCNLGIGNTPFNGTAVERIGYGNSLVTYWHCVTDDTYYSFCSYQDDSFAVYPSGGCTALPTGISVISPISFHIKPNPAQDEITINIDADMIGLSISIADMDGRSLLKTQLNSAENNISVSDLASGIYLLTLSENGQQAVCRKLVIAR